MIENYPYKTCYLSGGEDPDQNVAVIQVDKKGYVYLSEQSIEAIADKVLKKLFEEIKNEKIEL